MLTCACRYTTDTSYKEFEQMRIAMEPLVYAAGVDLFFYGEHTASKTAGFSALLTLIQKAGNGGELPSHEASSNCAAPYAGHVHAYERSTPVFNYTIDGCGPVHITIGVCSPSRHHKP